MPNYAYMDSFDDLGQHLKQFGEGMQARSDKKDQDKRDREYLDWLTGITTPKAPVDIPAPPQLGPGQHTGDKPIKGPQLPQGMQEPDPSVGPTDPNQGLPGGAPYSNEYLEDPNSLIEAEKAKAQQANDALFTDPANTMNMLIEARKRQVSPDMNSLLEFIADQQKTAQSQKFKASETDKAQKSRMATEEARTKSMTFRDEAKARLTEKLAAAANATRIKVAGMHGKKGPLDDDDINAMSDEELDALDAELQSEAGGISQPDKNHYDAYDGLSMNQYREDYRDFSDTKMAVDKIQRSISRAKTMRKSRLGGNKPRPAAPQAAPAPAKKGVYNPVTGQIEYR